MPTETRNCFSTSRIKLNFRAYRRGQEAGRTAVVAGVDLKIAQPRGDHAPAVGDAAAELGRPDLHVAAGRRLRGRSLSMNMRATSVSDRGSSKKNGIRDRTDEPVEAMIARQKAEDPPPAVERVAAFGEILRAAAHIANRFFASASRFLAARAIARRVGVGILGLDGNSL